MSTWLSEEWFAEMRALAADRSLCGGLSARVQAEVAGGPDGDLCCFGVFSGGRLEGSGLGRIDDPDVTLSASWADAAAIQAGRLDPSVAFMRGTLKVTGSMGLMLDLLPEARTERYQTLCRRIATFTEF